MIVPSLFWVKDIRNSSSWRSEPNMVLTNGCFDVLHAGHIYLLKAAAQLGNLMVAIDSDENVRDLKGPGRPIFPLTQRMETVDAIKGVLVVFPFSGSVEDVLKELKPDLYVKDVSWAPRPPGAEYAKHIWYCPTLETESTSQIIERIRKK